MNKNDNVVFFPTLPANHRNRTRLVDWLRQMANHIEADEMECEPHGASVVFTGDHVHEVLFVGYKEDRQGLFEACDALRLYVHKPSRAGKNQFQRVNLRSDE